MFFFVFFFSVCDEVLGSELESEQYRGPVFECVDFNQCGCNPADKKEGRSTSWWKPRIAHRVLFAHVMYLLLRDYLHRKGKL